MVDHRVGIAERVNVIPTLVSGETRQKTLPSSRFAVLREVQRAEIYLSSRFTSTLSGSDYLSIANGMMDEQAGQLDRLRQHLQQVQQDPSVALDEKLLDTAIYALVPTITPQDAQTLVLQIYQLLPSLQQDPTPVVRLLARLLEPVPLSAILSLEPPVDFIAGLQVATTPFNNLTLSLLEKADGNSARTLASAYPQLFISLVELWLSTQDEGVADKAGKALLHLLKIDLPDAGTVGLNGPVWKRIFRDKDVYERIFAITDTNTDRHTSLNKSRKTIAQARLLGWLPEVGKLDWLAISQSYHPKIESAFGLPEDQQSLLHYAMAYMVDYKRDVLMHRTLMSSYTSFLQINPENSLLVSPALDFLARTGLHKRTLDYYINPDNPSHDPLDVSFLYTPAAMYTARWVEIYPQALRENLQTAVLRKIEKAVNVPAARWAHSHSPSEDLHVLSSLPRSLLVSLGSANPALAIPSRAANTDALNCLATLFHGPLASEITFPNPTPPKANEEEEIKAAQALYNQYLAHNPRLWTDITQHADTIALAPQSLASISLMKAVLTAQWPGLEALMSDDSPAKATVVPWLLAPPKTFSNLVGGRGDAEGAAYKVAVAKFECLKVFERGLRESGTAEWAVVATMATDRVREGVFGKGAEVGGRIGVLEL
jgi:hypothetical protein